MQLCQTSLCCPQIHISSLHCEAVAAVRRVTELCYFLQQFCVHSELTTDDHKATYELVKMWWTVSVRTVLTNHVDQQKDDPRVRTTLCYLHRHFPSAYMRWWSLQVGSFSCCAFLTFGKVSVSDIFCHQKGRSLPQPVFVQHTSNFVTLWMDPG